MKYALLIKSGNDKVGDVYRVQWADTLQQAYSHWLLHLKSDTNGTVIKVLEVDVIEKK